MSAYGLFRYYMFSKSKFSIKNEAKKMVNACHFEETAKDPSLLEYSPPPPGMGKNLAYLRQENSIVLSCQGSVSDFQSIFLLMQQRHDCIQKLIVFKRFYKEFLHPYFFCFFYIVIMASQGA